MSLTATQAEPLMARQVISSLVGEPEADVSGLIDILGNRIGEQRLYRFAPVASDVPERSVARVHRWRRTTARPGPIIGHGRRDYWRTPS